MTAPIALESDPRAMCLPAIEFDGEALRLPVHVELEPLNERVDRWPRQSRFEDQRQKSVLTAGAGEGGVTIDRQDAPQPPAARVSSHIFQQTIELSKVEHPKLLRALNGSFETGTGNACRQVQQRSRHRRHRYPLHVCGVFFTQGRAVMDVKRLASPTAPGDAHLNWSYEAALDAPQPGRGAVTEKRMVAPGEHARETLGVWGETSVAHCIYASMDTVKASARDTPPQSALGIPQLDELTLRNDAVLLGSQFRDSPRSHFLSHTGTKGERTAFSPP